MERKKVQEKKIPTIVVKDRKKNLYRKVGGGCFHFGNKIIKPNQTFEAFEEEIPKTFLDVVILVREGDPAKKEITQELKKEKGLTYSIAESEDEVNKYDIFDASGKKVNEQPLTKPEAEKMVDVLK